MELFDRAPSPICRVCGDPTRQNAFLCVRCNKVRQRTGTGAPRKPDSEARLWAMKNQWKDGAFRCHFTGVELLTESHGHPRYATWEHLTPGVEESAVLAADIINRMKQNMTEAEFHIMVLALARVFTGNGKFDPGAIPNDRLPITSASGKMNRAELERRVDEWWREAVIARSEEFEGRYRPLLPTEVSDQDARSFLRGVDTQPPLIEVWNGYLTSPVMAPHKDGTPKDNFHLFEKTAVGTQLRSETIAHYGAITELILDQGWSPDAVVSEPHGSDEVSKGSVDAILKRGDVVVVCVEAKGPPTFLQHLVDGMNRCTGEVAPGHTKSDHNKCLGLLLFRSPYLLGVACGGIRNLYRVEFKDGFVRLLPEPELSVLDA